MSTEDPTPHARIVHPEPPKTEIAAIEASPHKAEIYFMLVSGWSPNRVAWYLQNKYQEQIEPSAIREFSELIPLEEFLPEAALRKRFQEIDIIIDPVTEAQLVLKLQQQRLDAALIHEGVTRKGLSPEVDREGRTYWKMLMEFIAMQHATGMLVAAQMPEDMPRNDGAITLKEIIETRKLRLVGERQAIAGPEREDVVDGEFAEVKR